MEPNKLPSNNLQITLVQQPKILLTEKPKPNYFVRLFSGRINRQNYIVGSTFFVLVPLLCFMVVLFNILLNPTTFAMPYINPNHPTSIITPHVSVVSLLEIPVNEIWSAIGVIFLVFSIPYTFSLQIRRLHDLNLNGWFWIVNFGSLLPLYSIYSMGISGMITSKPDAFFWISEVIGLIASFFSFYVSLWPGTKGPNKYGENPAARTSLLSDILALR